MPTVETLQSHADAYEGTKCLLGNPQSKLVLSGTIGSSSVAKHGTAVTQDNQNLVGGVHML